MIGTVAAFITFSRPERRGCALAGHRDASYQASFAGSVSTDQKRHDLLVSHNGSPVTGSVCVNTEMVGMSGMGYSDKGREVGPGRFQVTLPFGMAGTYRGNVVVGAKDHDVSIPVALKVAPPAR